MNSLSLTDEQPTPKKKPCLVCRQSRFEFQYENLLTRCLNCGFVSANLELAPDDIKTIYSQKYFAGEEYEDYVRDKSVLQSNSLKRLKDIFASVPREQISNVLEIGCAYGFFGDLLRREIGHAAYKGFDLAEEVVSYGRTTFGLDVSSGNYLDYAPGTKFTDVFLWDVIEHLERPDQFLMKIRDDSASGGRLYITTGDIGSRLARLQKRHWRMIHPPSHLHYFSRETITLLLKEHGYSVKRILYPATSRSVKGMFYSMVMLRKSYSQWMEALYNKIPESLFLTINTFDIMFIIAGKD